MCAGGSRFEISGLRWLCQRSRHCFPIRPGKWPAIIDHFLAPCLCTSSITLASSCGEITGFLADAPDEAQWEKGFKVSMYHLQHRRQRLLLPRSFHGSQLVSVGHPALCQANAMLFEQAIIFEFGSEPPVTCNYTSSKMIHIVRKFYWF